MSIETGVVECLDTHPRPGYSPCMSFGTKNRQKQTADACKEHLRTSYASQRVLVEDFIGEIEGKDRDATALQQFTDQSWNTAAMLKRVDQKFQGWLNGEP